MAVQCKSGNVKFDTSATTVINADLIPVATAVSRELPGELRLTTALQKHNKVYTPLSDVSHSALRYSVSQARCGLLCLRQMLTDTVLWH